MNEQLLEWLQASRRVHIGWLKEWKLREEYQKAHDVQVSIRVIDDVIQKILDLIDEQQEAKES